MKREIVGRLRLSLFILAGTFLVLWPGCRKDTVTASKDPLIAKNGMVVSTQRIASEVGVEILKKGGNAVDAAVAVSYALAVVHPSAGNIGGGGYMVIRWPNGRSTTVDYRETAPAKAHRDMYLDENGEVIPELSILGSLAAGVPGTVAGTILALEEYGTMSIKDVLEPAIKLADEGFAITPGLARALNSDRLKDRFRPFDGSSMLFIKPGEALWEAGENLRIADLANTFRLITDRGTDGFYKGKVADNIVRTMQKYKGIITHEDLENYKVIIRKPVEGTYRGYGIVSMPPSSSGGVALIQLLNILERFDIGASGWNSSETIHLVTEAERLVYADRSEYLGDPGFIDIPVNDLVSKKYADKRAETINLHKARPSDQVGPGNLKKVRPESEETTHYSVVDKDGIAVSVTTTINGGYGNSIVVEGSGFLLNNEMDDFSSKPGYPNMYGLIGSEANSIRPGKRMLSSMTPAIVTKNGKNFMIIGSPGGSTIITTVLQAIMNVIDHGMNISEAVNAARFHHQWYPDEIYHERLAFSKDTIEKLQKIGHELKERGNIGDAHGIIIDPETGLFYGGADRRLEGKAAGY